MFWFQLHFSLHWYVIVFFFHFNFQHQCTPLLELNIIFELKGACIANLESQIFNRQLESTHLNFLRQNTVSEDHNIGSGKKKYMHTIQN